MPKVSIPKPLEFDWDIYNKEKNWVKHQVDYKECEQAFKNTPTVVFEDLKHSHSESRYTVFGKTDKQRLVTITFTIRNQKVRVISARDQNKKERSEYAKKNKIPVFKNEDEERDFWATHSVLDFPERFKRIKMNFSELKVSTKPITIRLPESMIYKLKMMSSKRDVPYQSFIKTILADRIQLEYQSK